MIQINSMWGLGDNIFQRPIVAELSKQHYIEINTPWPQLYSDLPNVTPVMEKPLNLRTQLKNVNRNKTLFSRPSPNPEIKFNLRYNHQSGGALYEEMVASVPSKLQLDTIPRLSMPRFYLSHEVACILSNKKPIVIIRPGTIRTEWSSPARNTLPEYLCQAADILRARGWRIVVIADIQPGAEELVGDLPDFDEAYLRGQLCFEELMALFIGADLIVGEVGWIVPFSYASNQKAIIINGGSLGINAPEIVTPYCHRNDTNVKYIVPDEGCHCKLPRHQCGEESKIISHFEKRFSDNVGVLFP